MRWDEMVVARLLELGLDVKGMHSEEGLVVDV